MRKTVKPIGLALAAVVAIPTAASATSFTLSDLSSSMRIETQRSGTNPAGVVDWNITRNGQTTDVMYEEGFWYRLGGDTQERALADAPVVFEQASNTNANPGDDVLAVSYEVANTFRADVKYSLQGSTLGCCSDLAEQITITNLGTGLLAFTLFEYTDFDIGDIVDGRASFANTNTFFQSDGLWATETIVGPSPDRWEISYYADLKTRLDDANIDNLLNMTTPLTNGDLVWAAQWDFQIGSGASVTISKDKLVSTVPLPAPILMLGSALAGLFFVRRRRA